MSKRHQTLKRRRYHRERFKKAFIAYATEEVMKRYRENHPIFAFLTQPPSITTMAYWKAMSIGGWPHGT